MPESVTAIVCLIGGAVLGAVLTLGVERYLLRDKVRVEYRASTYRSFTDGVASLAAAKTQPDAESAASSVAAARGHIAIYGDSTVIVKLAIFLRNGAHVGNDPDGFTEVVRAMRYDITGDTSVSKENLKTLLVGTKNGREPTRN